MNNKVNNRNNLDWSLDVTPLEKTDAYLSFFAEVNEQVRRVQEGKRADLSKLEEKAKNFKRFKENEAPAATQDSA